MANILICDDSAFIRNRIKDILKTESHTFLDANDGMALLRIIGQEKFDCILLDINMPNKNGFEVLSELKALNNSTPVIVLTTDIDNSTKERCLLLGAFDFLGKPPTTLELLTSIKRAVSK